MSFFAHSLRGGWNFWLSCVQGAVPRGCQGLWIYCSCRKDRVYFSSTDSWWQLKHINGTCAKYCLLSVLPLIPIHSCFAMKKGRRRKRRNRRAVTAVSLHASELKSKQLLRHQYRYRIVFPHHGHIRNISGTVSVDMKVLWTADLHSWQYVLCARQC